MAEGYNNRKERKKMTKRLKAMGLIPKRESDEQRKERTARSKIAGQQIHSQFLAATETELRAKAVENEIQQVKNLAESIGEEKAKKMVENNRKLVAAREAKQAAKAAARKANPTGATYDGFINVETINKG